MGVYGGGVLVFVVAVVVAGTGGYAGGGGTQDRCAKAKRGMAVTFSRDEGRYGTYNGDLVDPHRNPPHTVVAAGQLEECLDAFKNEVTSKVDGMLETKVKDFHFKNGFNIANTAFGHGRYAAEYAALCGIYNLYDAVDNMDPPKELQTWSELVKPLEYLAISLAPDGWCNSSGEETENVEKARLPDDGNGDNYTVEKCAERIKEIRDATAKNKEKAFGGTKKKTELKKVDDTDLTFHPDVTSEKAKKRAYTKVLKLLLKAKGFQGGYEAAYKAANGAWESEIKRKLQEIFDEDYAKSIGRGNNAGTLPQAVKCNDGNTACPGLSSDKPDETICSPEMIKANGGDTWMKRVDGTKFSAGHNILVDMACLCIPKSGTCTACTGTQPIPAWKDGNPTTDGIKTQIQMLIDGCKARNTYGRVTSETISQTLKNFDKLLGRWKGGADKTYTLADPNKRGNAYTGGTAGYPSILGKSYGGTCDGDEYKHCVSYTKYTEEEAPEPREPSERSPTYEKEYPQWYKKVKSAGETLKSLEQAYENASVIHHKIDILTEAAIQARDEALLPEDPSTVATSAPLENFDLVDHMQKHCAKQTTEELCSKAPFCKWEGEPVKCGIGTSVAVPLMTEKQHKEFVEMTRGCGKIHQEEDCQNVTGCEFRQGKCAPVMQGFKAHIPLNPSHAYLPTFSVLSLLALF